MRLEARARSAPSIVERLLRVVLILGFPLIPLMFVAAALTEQQALHAMFCDEADYVGRIQETLNWLVHNHSGS
nr:hypothetical protein RNT25_04390 [arsenite-oxidising bacterium NT-25]